MSFLDGPVRVSVPATSANLGPGFDSLGLALELRDELTAEVGGDWLGIEVTGEGAERGASRPVPPGRRAMDAAFGAHGCPRPPLTLSTASTASRTRAGSARRRPRSWAGSPWPALWSATVAERLDDTQVLALATAVEGHPDNVAAAIFGGFVISGEDDEDVWADQAPRRRARPNGRVRAVTTRCPPRSRAVCCLPSSRTPTPLRTPDVPPCSSPRSRTRRSACSRATEDFLHQEYRRPAMPESLALIDRLRERRSRRRRVGRRSDRARPHRRDRPRAVRGVPPRRLALPRPRGRHPRCDGDPLTGLASGPSLGNGMSPACTKPAGLSDRRCLGSQAVWPSRYVPATAVARDQGPLTVPSRRVASHHDAPVMAM